MTELNASHTPTSWPRFATLADAQAYVAEYPNSQTCVLPTMQIGNTGKHVPNIVYTNGCQYEVRIVKDGDSIRLQTFKL